MVVSDVHGNQQDEITVAAAIEFAKDFNPQIRVIAGDLWDFRQLRKGASDEEKAGTLETDWAAGIEFANAFFKGGKENHFLRGNHDERMWHHADACTGMMRDFARDGIKRIEGYARKWRSKMLPYDSALGILKIGSLSVIHGYHAGASAASMHARVYGNSIFGHVHTIESCAVPSLVPAEARSIGCLCKRDMDYMANRTGKLRWGQGWAYGLVFPDGTYVLNQARKIEGKFICATDFKAY